MPISKTITDSTGYDLDYIRIGSIYIDAITNAYRIEIFGFKSQEDFENGNEPIMKRVFGLNPGKIESLGLDLEHCSANLIALMEEAATLVFDDLSDAILT